MAWIQTYSGKRFELDEEINPDTIDIEDIAHALSQICRFGGHTRQFYSVAEHSVRVAHLLVDQGRAVQLQGLLHDAAEAYLGDIVRPLKTEAQREREHVVHSAIIQKFGIEQYGVNPLLPSVIALVDEQMLQTEARDTLLFGKRSDWAPSQVDPLPDPLSQLFWNSTKARACFLALFHSLTEHRFTTPINPGYVAPREPNDEPLRNLAGANAELEARK